MPSTFSTSLRLELIGNGEQAGNWGNTTNVNLGTLIEQAITGVGNISMGNADYTLISGNGISDESRNAVLIINSSTALTSGRNVIIPSVKKVYVVRNLTSGGQIITIKTSAGSGVAIANGFTQIVYCDGTNTFVGSLAIDAATGGVSFPGTIAIASGGTGAATATDARTNLGVLASVSPVFTGNMTGPSAGIAGLVQAGSFSTTGTLGAGATTLSGNLTTTSTAVSCGNGEAGLKLFRLKNASKDLSLYLDASNGTAGFVDNNIPASLASPVVRWITDNSGNFTIAGAYASGASDVRLKENVKNIPDAINKVNRINGVTFNFNNLASSSGLNLPGDQVGVIAQEIESVLPEAVAIAPFDTAYVDGGKVSKSGQNYKTVQYEKIVPLLIEAIKELSAKVNDLEKRIQGD